MALDKRFEYHLLETQVVGHHHVVEGVAVADTDLSFLGLRADDVETLVHECVKVHRFRRQADVARFHARDVQDLVDQRQKMLTGLEHVIDEFEVLFGLELHLQNLREAEHRVEWCAQFVAHA